jgi:hypothetical protein
MMKRNTLFAQNTHITGIHDSEIKFDIRDTDKKLSREFDFGY